MRDRRNRGHHWSLRASDADRERVAALLRDHATVGRLSFDELDERLERAYAARTYGELGLLLVDLPGPSVFPSAPDRRRERRSAAERGRGMSFAFAAVAVLMLAPILFWTLFSLVIAFGLVAITALSVAAPFALAALLAGLALRRLPAAVERSRLDARRTSWPAR
jgi:hypothetical protein